MAGVENHAAGAGALHDVDRTVQRHGPADEVQPRDEVVVLMKREAGNAVDVVRAVDDVLDRSDRLACGVQPLFKSLPSRASVDCDSTSAASEADTSASAERKRFW